LDYMAQTDMRLEAALHIVRILVENGYRALFAGGYVRDALMGIENNGDIDIATNAKPVAISRLFAHTIGVGEQFGVMIVVEKGIPFEVATFRSDIGVKDGRHPKEIVFTDEKSDALRRDFTINGMFYDPLLDKVIDHVGGIDDIKSRKIRAIGNPENRFSEDFLRMLRAVRFSARFDYDIDEKTWNALKTYASEINRISPERIFSELDKMLLQPNQDKSIILLKDSGLLAFVLPEVQNLSGIPQPPEYHPEGDVFEHTVKALKLLESGPSQILAWSILLHDIGKPPTLNVSDRIRFNNHDRVGAAMASDVLRRLHASNILIEGVVACVDNHMNFMNVTKMRLSTLKKFLSRHTIHDELEMHRIDCLASHGDLNNYYFIKEKLTVMAKEQIRPEPFLKGRDLLEKGFKPGPLFGEILSEIYDLQLEEKLDSRESALKYLEEKWNTEHKPL
jgi:tRNA nucleotidyltransferase/poly(A) polymerase